MDLSMSVCFCTLAIHAPYRQRARRLCAGAQTIPWLVATDEPADFADLPVHTITYTPTGPMAVDYLTRLPPTGQGHGAAAYHDKRFAIYGVLQRFDTAIYIDADSLIARLPPLGAFPPGLAVLPVVKRSVADHLDVAGSWRKPIFMELARELTGDAGILQQARWCHEALIAVTRDTSGAVSRFITAWSFAADFLQTRNVFSGEGGAIGLAAAYAGWAVDYDALTDLGAAIQHEGGGPKAE